MKRLQEDTMTKMAVLGRGSMKDKQKVTISINPLFLELDRNYEDFVYIL
jgi:hypothetical protein